MGKKLVKKVIAIALIAVFCIGMMPVRSLAEEYKILPDTHSDPVHYDLVYAETKPNVEGAVQAWKIFYADMYITIGLNELDYYKNTGWTVKNYENWTVDIEEIAESSEEKLVKNLSEVKGLDYTIKEYNVYRTKTDRTTPLIKGSAAYQRYKSNPNYTEITYYKFYGYYNTITSVSSTAPSSVHMKYKNSGWKNIGSDGKGNTIYGKNWTIGYGNADSYYTSRGGRRVYDYAVFQGHQREDKKVSPAEYNASYKGWNIESIKVIVKTKKTARSANIKYSDFISKYQYVSPGVYKSKTNNNITYKVINSHIMMEAKQLKYEVSCYMTFADAKNLISKNDYKGAVITNLSAAGTGKIWLVPKSGQTNTNNNTTEPTQNQQPTQTQQQNPTQTPSQSSTNTTKPSQQQTPTQQQGGTTEQKQPKNTEEKIDIPETVNFELSEDAYKEYINQLFETKNAQATEGDIAPFLEKTKGETTNNILSSFENLSAQDFIELIKKDVVHISESNVTIEKAKTLLENGQITKQQAVLYILSNTDIQHKMQDYYQGIVEKKLRDEGLTGLDSEDEQQERINSRTTTIEEEMLKNYFRAMYRMLANKSDAESVVSIDEEDLQGLIDFYNKGYDVEDCVAELLIHKDVIKNPVLADIEDPEFIEKVYPAIIFATPNEYNLGKLTKKLEQTRNREDIVTSILKSSEFVQLKQSLIDGTFKGEVTAEQEETFNVCTTGERGDLDGDGRITCADAQLLLNIVTDAALHEEKYVDLVGVLDINYNGEVDVDDAKILLEYYVKVDLMGKTNEIDTLDKYIDNRKSDD